MADKYQKLQPGEYFDWEQPQVNEHLEQFEQYKKDPGGHFLGDITLTEQMIVDHNKRWNMLDPLYTDTEYARAHGHPGCPALPCLVGMGGHGAAPCANFPHDMGDRFYYTAIGGETLKLWRVEEAAGGEGAPGAILCADPREGLVIQAGEQAVRVLELQAQGGKRMPAKDYLRGHPLKASACDQRMEENTHE